MFLVAADIRASVSSSLWGLAVWIAAGLLSLIRALTFAELGGRFPGTGVQLFAAGGGPAGQATGC